MVDGGRYHTIHVFLRGCADSFGLVVKGSSVLVRDDVEVWGAMFLSAGFELSRFSAVVGVLALLLKSRAFPGVRGVLFADEPKEAKAPEPRPNAEDAPVVGVLLLVVLRGSILLKGFGLPVPALSGPMRLAEGKARE